MLSVLPCVHVPVPVCVPVCACVCVRACVPVRACVWMALGVFSHYQPRAAQRDVRAA